MRLNEGRPGTANVVRSYGAEGVTVGAVHHPLPLLLTAEAVEGDLQAAAIEYISAADVARVLAHAPDVVLVGSAGGVRFAPAAVRRAFEEKRVAIECMDLGAACRTFNVLAQENRAVLALLFP
jgi:uncharacterized protein